MVTQPFRIERWKNGASTTLSASATATDTTISVTSASGFPTSGDFRVLIDGSEEVTVKSVSGTTFTLTAGLASSYAGTETVELVATADGVDDAFQQAFGYTEYPFNRILSAGVTKTASDFTWLNQGTATCTDADDGGLNMTLPSEANHQIRGKYLTAPSTPYEVISYVMLGPGFANAATYAGPFLRESSTGKLYIVELQTDKISLWRMTDQATYSADVGTYLYNLQHMAWLKLGDNGTNVYGEVSYDGVNWFAAFSEGRTSFMSGGPDQVGFGASSGSGASGQMVHFKTWILE